MLVVTRVLVELETRHFKLRMGLLPSLIQMATLTTRASACTTTKAVSCLSNGPTNMVVEAILKYLVRSSCSMHVRIP